MARRDRAASDRRAFVARAATVRGARRAAAAAAATGELLLEPEPGSAAVPAPAPAPASVPALAGASVPAAAPRLQRVQGELGLAVAPAESWIALHLAGLAVAALRSSPASGSPPAPSSVVPPRALPPLAVFEAQGGMPRVVAVDAAARARGVAPGMTLAAALAMAAELDARPRQPRRERALLARLAEAGFAFTPRVSLEPPDGVLLEVRGSLGLFGGAAALCEAVQARCAALGVEARLALAPTPLAALALARAGRALAVTGSERLVGALAPLPLAALRWSPAACARLESMGVRTVGEALRLPRAGFARRFGRGALEDLDRLVGRRPDLRRPFVAREAFRGRCEPSFELEYHEAILRHLEPLLAELEGFLRSRQAAVLGLRLRLRHRPDPCDGSPRTTPLELRLAAPEFAAARFGALLGEHLARFVLPAPVVVIELRSGELQPLAAQSESLWRAGEHGGGAAREASALVERLRARLGPGAVYGLCLVPEHRPERAWQAAEPGLLAAPASTSRFPAAARRRPLWLLQAPQCLEHGIRALRLLDGPERIESGWWDGQDVARDYYVARDVAGAVLWIFRERLPPHAWFLHGVFG
jgi:protein ImuB